MYTQYLFFGRKKLFSRHSGANLGQLIQTLEFYLTFSNFCPQGANPSLMTSRVISPDFKLWSLTQARGFQIQWLCSQTRMDQDHKEGILSTQHTQSTGWAGTIVLYCKGIRLN